MFSKYVEAAIHHAAYSLVEDSTFFGEPTLEACRDELKDVIEG